MNTRMVPRAHAKDIAELAVDLSEKAHAWKVRAKAAEAALIANGIPVPRMPA